MPDILVEKIVYPGKSLGRLGGVVWLTDEGLPGERIEVEPRKERPRLVEARTTRVIHPSPLRREPRCGHYRACSPYQIMDDALQAEIKRNQLGEILAAEIAGMPPIQITSSPLAWNYRRRARFHVLWTDRGARPAYNVSGTRNEFIPVDICHLLAPPLSDLIASALQAFPGRAPGLREIEARVGTDESAPLLIFHWSIPPGPKDLDAVLSGLSTGIYPAGVVSVFRNKGRDEEALVWGRGWIEEKVGAATFRIGARSFFQVNPSILPAVIEVMAEALQARRVRRLADLYCGLGLFGLALAPLVDTVAAVESEPANVRNLKENAGRQGAPGVTVYDGRAEDWMVWLLDRGVDAVIVDPPRKGLDASLIGALSSRPVPLVLYLSCNPTTLARDLAMMRPAYRPVLVQGFDFFPQTPHIETLAILEKR